MPLNEDDKKWLVEQLAPLATGLQVLTATVELLQANQQRQEAKLAQLAAKIESVETNLLTEFHKWASPNEARQRTHTATLRAIDLEMEARSERIDKLEDPGRTH